jgi:hypothetical protein
MQDWWFNSLGQEFGPVSFDDLVKAARSGALIATDLVRRGDLGQWQPAYEVKELRFRSNVSDVDLGIKRSGRIDSLEQLILEILRTQPGGQSKPTLEELGVAPQDVATASKDAPSHVLAVKPTTVVSLPSLFSVKKLWPTLFRLSVFPQQIAESTQTSESLVSAVGQASAAPAILQCRERTYSSATSNAVEDHQAEKLRQRRVPIRELVYALSGFPLYLLLFPEAWSKLSGYINVVNWSWKGWGIAEAVLLIALIGIAVRQRQKQLA